MARDPVLCAPPRHASRNSIAAVTARRLFTRTCSSLPLPDETMAVGLKCGTADPQTLFLTTRWRSVLRCEKANTKTPRSFARLDPVFARDSSGCSVPFSIKEESTRLGTLFSFSKRPDGKEPPRVKLLWPPARAPLQKTPTGSMGSASSSSTLTHVLQATSAPVVQEEDPTLSDGPAVTPRPSA